MREVISFRLDKTKLREARALEVLNAWVEKGFSTRHILTTAMLELDHPGSDLELVQGDRDWGSILDQIGQLLEFVETLKTKPISSQDYNPDQTNLNDSFPASIKHRSKPGIKLR